MNLQANLAKPDWIRIKMPSGQCFAEVRSVVQGSGVRTVCDSSQCPNISECWGKRTATFMILGGVCTRACRFCSVPPGDPKGVIDLDEPGRIAIAVAKLGLRYAVITSVTRDDLEDGGASEFFRTVAQIRQRSPGTKIELLIPDMCGGEEALRTVAASNPDVIGHNLEVVESLQSRVRDPGASYERSLSVLEALKRLSPGTLIKTSLMLGFGETREELLKAMRDARERGADLLTLGQYLRPRGGSLAVVRYVPPAEFAELRLEALRMGFLNVLAGPLVRSSYHAREMVCDEKEECEC